MTLRELIDKWCISRWITRMMHDPSGNERIVGGHNELLSKLNEINEVRVRNRKQVDALMRELADSINEGALQRGLPPSYRKKGKQNGDGEIPP